MSTGSELSALLSLDFEQIFGQIVSIRVRTLNNTNLVVSRHIKREKSSLPVEVRRSKASLLKLPSNCYFGKNTVPFCVQFMPKSAGLGAQTINY